MTIHEIDGIGKSLGMIAAREAAMQLTSAELEEADRLKAVAAELPLAAQQRIINMATDMQLLAMRGFGLMGDSEVVDASP